MCFLLVLGFFFSALLAVLPRAAHLWWAARGEYLPGGVLGGGVGFLGVGCDYAGPLQSGHLLFPSCALCRTSVFGGVFWSTDSCVCVCVHVSDSLIVGGETASGRGQGAGLRRRGAADFRENIPDPMHQILCTRSCAPDPAQKPFTL